MRVVIGTCCSKEENICNVFRYFSFCSVPVTSGFVSAITFVKRSCSWRRSDLNSVSWFYDYKSPQGNAFKIGLTHWPVQIDRFIFGWSILIKIL